MKFSIEREQLLQPLQNVIGAVERRQTLPVLGNVLLEAESSRLTLTASDTEIELQSSTDLPVEVPGAITIPARKLLDICKALPDHAKLEIEHEGEQVKCQSGRSRFVLTTLPASEFPKVAALENSQSITLNEASLLHAIKASSFSMAQQDVRFYLNGLLMEISKGKLCCVATDGHRLAYSECSSDADPSEPVRAIIPRKSILELSRLLTPDENRADLSITNNHLQIKLLNIKMTTKLIEGRFPDYNRVIPIDGDKELLIDRDLLKQSLSRAAILSNEKYRGVRLAVKPGVLTISSNNPEQEEAVDEMEVDYSGEPAEIGFNVNYLLDVLSTIDPGNARIRLKDGNSSALVTPESSDLNKYVIMPMRL